MTEAEQIKKLKTEIEKLQEQIRELSLHKGMKTWQIRLLWVTIALCILTLPMHLYWAIALLSSLFT